MKKSILLTLLIICMAGILYSQILVVTSPNAAAKWVKGRNYVITWDKTGEMAVQVKIILFRADKEVLIIADSTDNDGAHSWIVPSDLIPSKYTIQVITADDSVSDFSDAFSVEKAPVLKMIKPAVVGTLKKSPPHLKILSPNGGESLTVGSEEEITWECSGLTGNVNLMLFKKNEEGSNVQIVNIARNIPVASRSYTWEVGKHASGTVKPYEMYTVEIQTPDRKYKDESDQTFAVVYPSGKATTKPTSEQEDQKKGASTKGSEDMSQQTQSSSTEGKTGDAANTGSTIGEKREQTPPIYVSPIPDLRCRIVEVKRKTEPLPFPPGAVLRRVGIRYSLRYDTSGKETLAPRFKIRTMLIDKKLNKVIKSNVGTIVNLSSNKWESKYSKVYKKLLKRPYIFVIILDPENDIRESREDNNRRERQFKFNK